MQVALHHYTRRDLKRKGGSNNNMIIKLPKHYLRFNQLHKTNMFDAIGTLEKASGIKQIAFILILVIIMS